MNDSIFAKKQIVNMDPVTCESYFFGLVKVVDVLDYIPILPLNLAVITIFLAKVAFDKVIVVEWLFTETPFHRSGFSPNVLSTEKAAIHLWDCSPNVQ